MCRAPSQILSSSVTAAHLTSVSRCSYCCCCFCCCCCCCCCSSSSPWMCRAQSQTLSFSTAARLKPVCCCCCCLSLRVLISDVFLFLSLQSTTSSTSWRSWSKVGFVIAHLSSLPSALLPFQLFPNQLSWSCAAGNLLLLLFFFLLSSFPSPLSLPSLPLFSAPSFLISRHQCSGQGQGTAATGRSVRQR
jgi:hypothetical protein